jgi:hypothetical protein
MSYDEKRSQIYGVNVRNMTGRACEEWEKGHIGHSSISHDNFAKNIVLILMRVLIQVDIDGHPPFPTGSKQFSDNFGNLLFLAVFNFRGHFEALKDIFGKTGRNMKVSSIFPPK